MKLLFSTMDVFTQERFGGNPLSIVQGADELQTELMQKVAREFNLSETIFILKAENPENHARVRIFTPASELPFAGHPTVGAACFLAEQRFKRGCAFETDIRLETKAGLVPVKVTRIGDRPRAVVTAPRIADVIRVDVDVAKIAGALGLESIDIGSAGHQPRVLAAASQFLAVPVASIDALGRASPSQPLWAELLRATECFSVYCYCASAPGRWRVRLFAPDEGIPEDPATGSAAAAFASQLLAFAPQESGLLRVSIEQGLEMGRPSEITIEADVRDGVPRAVRIGGYAVLVMTGNIEV